MRLLAPRSGEVVKVLQRPTPYSYWPTIKQKRREKLQSLLFITDPWNLIKSQTDLLTDATALSQARAYLNQANDFYSASENAGVEAAKPLLLYYSFLNLVKCFAVTKRGKALGKVLHGLSEKLPTAPGSIHGHVSADITKSPQTSAFCIFAKALGAALPTPAPPDTHVQFRSQDFLAQILVGHRIFCRAENLNERFISIDSIEYMHDSTTKEAWLRARAFADDFTRLSYPLTTLRKSLSDHFAWRNVVCENQKDGRRLIEAETTTTLRYGQRPSQIMGDLSRSASSKLWRSVTAYPPYRKYYIYVPAPKQYIIHQLLSLYLATFYFGSITRYKPEQFDGILKSPLGPFVYEFFTNQPSQFIYLLASEFVQQEVAKAAIT